MHHEMKQISPWDRRPRGKSATTTKKTSFQTNKRRQDCNAFLTTLLYWCDARKTTLDSIDSLRDLIISFIQILFTYHFLHGLSQELKLASYKQNLFSCPLKSQKRTCFRTQKIPRFLRETKQSWGGGNSPLNKIESMPYFRFISLQSLSRG